MDNNWYATMVSDAAEIAAFFFDLTGGKWTLALLCETLEELLSADNIPSAITVICRLYETAGQPLTWVEQINAESGALFVGAMADIFC